MSWLRGKGPRLASVTVLLLLVLSVGYTIALEISKDVPGSLTIRSVRTIPPSPAPTPTTSPDPTPTPAGEFVPLKERADIDGSGVIDLRDLIAVARKLKTQPAGEAKEDVNQDGTINIVDLAIVADTRLYTNTLP